MNDRTRNFLSTKLVPAIFWGVAFVITVPALAWAASYFYVGNNGDIGIGTDSPQSMLDVVGAIYSRLVTPTDAASLTVNWNSGNVQALTLNTANTTLIFSNGQSGGDYALVLNQDGTGGRTVTWPAAIKWPGGNVPALTSTASSTDMFRFVFDGTNYLASYTSNLATAPALSANVVSYYKFSGNSNDAVGSNNGTDTSVSYSSSYGKIGQGASYNGTSSYTSVADASNLDFTGAFTLSGWINVQSFSGGNWYIGAKTRNSSWSSGAGAQWYLRVDNATTLEGGINTGSLQTCTKTISSLSTGTWHFVAMTWNGSTATLYIDGASQGTCSISGTISTGAYPMYLGANNLSAEYGQEYLDEVGIWNRALSAGDITSLYNGGSGDQYPF